MAKNPSTTTHGIDLVTFGLVDDDGQLIKGKDGLSEDGLYSPKMNYEGASTANITGLEANGTAQFANNVKKRTSESQSSPQVALTFLDIGFVQYQKILGYEQDANDGGWSLKHPKPHVAMLLKSTGLDGSTVYEGFAKGTAIEPTKNHGTDTQNEVDSDAAITYEAETPDAEVFKTSDGRKTPYRRWNTSDPSFKTYDAVLTQVFPGYTASTSDPDHKDDTNKGTEDNKGTDTDKGTKPTA